MNNNFISYDDFKKVDMRIGKIIEVEEFSRAEKSAYKLKIDFGNLGIKTSSAQITDLYSKEDLMERLIVAVVNFPPKNIAGFQSEVLVLGIPDNKGRVILLKPDKDSPLGSRVF
jgi:tRNA-binding protein